MAFAAATPQPTLVIGMLLTYLVGKRWWPALRGAGRARCGHCIGWVARGNSTPKPCAGIWPARVGDASLVLARHDRHGSALFIVTMASQAVPGYRPSGCQATNHRCRPDDLVRHQHRTAGPFGGYTFNLAAITAAIVLNPTPMQTSAQRYSAA